MTNPEALAAEAMDHRSHGYADPYLPPCFECDGRFYGDNYGEEDFTPCPECYEPLHVGDCLEQHLAQHCELTFERDARDWDTWCEAARGW